MTQRPVFRQWPLFTVAIPTKEKEKMKAEVYRALEKVVRGLKSQSKQKDHFCEGNVCIFCGIILN